MRELDGKVCAITGGAGGIGRALARRFVDAGMRVVLADVEAKALDAAVGELGHRARGVQCDVTSTGSRRPYTVDALTGTPIAAARPAVRTIGRPAPPVASPALGSHRDPASLTTQIGCS
jgi:NAD(P)-dependent dehydrogenase (short-subunit alcohol dehydrogenase family)